MGGPVDAHVIEIESHDPVIGGDRFGRDQLEQPQQRPTRRGGTAASCPTPAIPAAPPLTAMSSPSPAAPGSPKSTAGPVSGADVPLPGSRTGRAGSIGSTAAQITSTTSGSKSGACVEIGLHGLSCSAQTTRPTPNTGEPANPWMANPRGLLGHFGPMQSGRATARAIRIHLEPLSDDAGSEAGSDVCASLATAMQRPSDDSRCYSLQRFTARFDARPRKGASTDDSNGSPER